MNNAIGNIFDINKYIEYSEIYSPYVDGCGNE